VGQRGWGGVFENNFFALDLGALQMKYLSEGESINDVTKISAECNMLPETGEERRFALVC
jgi:hypothetical protein